nr:immunoglobulin light chain junction region [Macaca mulatta]MOW03514.1 immunoglobulin light chain junction region [Macaca mulatta]
DFYCLIWYNTAYIF